MNKMKFYLAPMEGITGFVYRNAYHKYFHACDKYFLPFISPNPKGKFAPWEEADLQPEHNIGMHPVPQILTNRAEEFISTAQHLKEYGFQEVNLNLGCPSKTVVSKGKGSGFLSFTDQLDSFLEQIFKQVDIEISIKTRIGRYDHGEWEELLAIYNQYPVKELIIHPRVQKDLYGNEPDYEAFRYAIEHAKCPLCYNGDLFTKEDFDAWKAQFPKVEQVMLGRGILRNPNLIGTIKDETTYDRSTYQGFHDDLFKGFLETIHGERNAVFKMKEMWSYLRHSFTDADLYLPEIRKASNTEEYLDAVGKLFANVHLE